MNVISAPDKLGIYIHIPFCRSKCAYCDFYSMAGREERMDDYQKALLAHLKETAVVCGAYRVDTIYFGGGTPSFYGDKRLREILACIKKHYHVEPDAEITTEANPDSISFFSALKLRRAGFNRISLGMQTACPEELKAINRIHTAKQTDEAVSACKKAGFKNLSLDLIYGLPGQSMDSWKRSVEHALSLIPQHLSCYGLKVEEGTPLYEYREHADLPDDDTQADMYMVACETLRGRGFKQYEISNFCRKGLSSRHNMKYWTGGEYLGFGPSASSDFAGKRYTNLRSLSRYIEGIEHGGQVIEEIEEVPVRERAGEYLMLRLRTSFGISREEYERKYLLPFDPLEKVLLMHQDKGLARFTNDRWRLTPEGLLVSNSVISDLLLVQDQSEPLAKRRFSH